ncbi:HigA family addiction module antidote protein [Pseudoflavitalea sp. X16]|uniref:HigA family addiction module antitoxin n=1 Tax=Paraflavitalea devenefica TaxID=2716334 RepID=UPI0014212208|nr:HigA family addiction module antitoxin [Paraflavitalea devenefica]NII25433.1 HigA family addiction module antidote protein [Paraflavitalea devenefica]
MLKRGLPHTHPGEILKSELVEERGLTITEIAKAMGLSRVAVSNVLNEKAAVTPEFAVRFATVFGGTADIWLRLQASYDLEQAEKKVKRLKLKPYQYKHSA